jgi:hypothetical protein
MVAAVRAPMHTAMHFRCPCAEEKADRMPKFGGPNRGIGDDAATIAVDLAATHGGAVSGSRLPEPWPTLTRRTPATPLRRANRHRRLRVATGRSSSRGSPNAKHCARRVP